MSKPLCQCLPRPLKLVHHLHSNSLQFRHTNNCTCVKPIQAWRNYSGQCLATLANSPSTQQPLGWTISVSCGHSGMCRRQQPRPHVRCLCNVMYYPKMLSQLLATHLNASLLNGRFVRIVSCTLTHSISTW